MPREGSFALALFGRIRKVHVPPRPVCLGCTSVALKRIIALFFWTPVVFMLSYAVVERSICQVVVAEEEKLMCRI
jgi:hypothetical protein